MSNRVVSGYDRLCPSLAARSRQTNDRPGWFFLLFPWHGSSTCLLLSFLQGQIVGRFSETVVLLHDTSYSLPRRLTCILPLDLRERPGRSTSSAITSCCSSCGMRPAP